MVKEIVKDKFLLSQKSREATIQDLETAQNLMDTLDAHRDHCVGLAANMIGSLVRIAVIMDHNRMVCFINPKVIFCSGKKICEEGCLCHVGTKETVRYEKIKVEYQDMNMKKKMRTLTGFEAQILQHEMDHFEGILI